MELKKAANHPFLFEGAESRSNSDEEVLKGLVMSSGKMVLLDKLLGRLHADGHRVLIFTQMTRILDILEKFLNFHGYLYLRLDGATKIEDRQYITERFNVDTRIFAFIASSRSGGVGIK